MRGGRCMMNKKNNYVEDNKKRKKKRIPFLYKFCLCTLAFAILFLVGIELVITSLDINHKEKLYFKEQGSVKYSVCLKKNDFFDEECLGSNMSYVAGLIKNISLDFNYQFNGNIDNLIDSVDYEIIAKLVIKNSDTAARYYEKEYVLVPKTNDGINSNNTLYNLNKKIEIDYEYYNNIATSFKSQYGIDSQSYLDIYLNAYNNVNPEYSGVPSSGKILAQIPLSQKAIEIKLSTQEINNNIEKTITARYFNVINWLRLITGLVSLLASLFFLYLSIIIVKKYSKKISKYDKLINKILKEYDRLIVETSTLPEFDNYNVLLINSFEELIDVRDNLRLPIMFYIVKEHEEAQFYILQDNNLYLYTISATNVNNDGRK